MMAIFLALVLCALVMAPRPALAASRAVDPEKRECFGACTSSARGCKRTAATVRDATKAACVDAAAERACRKEAKGDFKIATKTCRTLKKACKLCCKEGGTVCARPPDLPAPFPTGIASGDVSFDAEGCLPSTDGAVVSTDLGVTVELADATCLRRWDGTTIAGPSTVHVDDAGGILAQGSQGFLQGVIRVTVAAPGVGDQFVAFDTPATIRLELDDGSLPGSWEAVAWAEGDTYAAGPTTGGVRPEVSVTVVPIRPDGPEEFQYWGSGPVGIRYVPPPAALQRMPAAAVASGASGSNTVRLDLLQAGLPGDFATTYPLLCNWFVTVPRTGQVLAAEPIPAGLPHGETSASRGYRATVRVGDPPTFEVQSAFFNRLIPTGAVCDGGEDVLDFNEASRRAAGGSAEESHLPGPYDGRIVLMVGGQGSGMLVPLTQELRTSFAEPQRVLVRSYREFPAGFAMIADLYGHPDSVRTIPSVLPPAWRYDFDDRHAVVNVTPTTTTTSSTTTTLQSRLRILECTRSAFAEGTATVRGGLSDACDDSTGEGESSASCAATASGGDTTASASGDASFTLSVTGGEVVPGLMASGTAAAGASGGGPLDHGAGGSGRARVQCFVAVDAPMSFTATGGGSAGPASSFSTVEVVFAIDGGADIARFEQAGGKVFDTFPASGVLEPGIYEISFVAFAEANLVRGGSGSAAASFALTVGTAP